MRTLFLLAALAALAAGLGCSPNVSPENDGGTGGGGGGAAGGGSGGGAAGGGSGGGAMGGGGGTDAGTGGGTGDGGVPCTPACGAGRECCDGSCVNLANDPLNCGACGVKCEGATPYCGGSCSAPPCFRDGGSCGTGTSCCGAQCCGVGQLCCDPQGSVSGFVECYTLDAGETTCPQGCQPLCASDRNVKSDIEPVDEGAVLEQVASLPIYTWRYTSDANKAPHLGPMAQDFRATFKLGDTDTGYYAVDSHGVSLAAIKALYAKVQAQEQRLERLEAQNAKLRRGVCDGADGTR